jgi:glycosyltransferase involved in cell wall biosynthesis
MKILQIITSLYTGGAEKLLVDSIPLYRKMGIDMDLLVLNGDETPFFHSLKKSGVKIHYLTKGNIKKIYNPLLVFRIIPYLKKYDMIHVHLFPTLYWVALAKLLILSKIKLIFTEHNTNNTRILKKGIWKKVDKFIYRQYDKIVSITAEVQKVITDHLSDFSEKFCVINNGIILSDWYCEKIKNKETETKTVIQVSAFRPQKDQMTLIRAMQYLPDDVRLLLVGDGDMRPKCEELVKELNLSDRVSFLGVRTDVPELLHSADITVLSSHYEGFGLTSIEGMAACKPVIASDVPGLREVVAGVGLLFPVGDEKILAERINELLSDSDYYKKVAKACLDRSKKYDINKMVDQYIELYKSIQNG